MIIDIVIVALIVLAAIVALVVIYFKWRKERVLYGDKQMALVKEAAQMRHSSLVD
ncbi:MAG: hypothetical protein KKD18_05935 [Nanoarchaeota archaeon]|nr:hypothetical protein [Nanoarchaeota archaeon]MBU0977931.1 hypothetical protein [Nanoarchaeota archaeon]